MNKMDSASNLVVGLGEVGQAIAKILQCDGIDKDQTAPLKSYKFLHICIGYSPKFVEIVKQYQHQYTPDYTIIHSTVPIGTSRECDAVHSPVRGVHPNLEQGIRTFIKYFGGRDSFICSQVFVEKGLSVKSVPDSETTEALKMWDTTQYGAMILLNKEIHRFCKENNLDFDIIYTHANRTYNEGYAKLNRPEVARPYLAFKNEKIGGHCVIPNAYLLESKTAYRIRKYNETGNI